MSEEELEKIHESIFKKLITGEHLTNFEKDFIEIEGIKKLPAVIENEKLKLENKVLRNRFQHLIKSKIISSYDRVDFNGKYIKDINKFDEDYIRKEEKENKKMENLEERKNICASKIEFNVKAEADARENYYELLNLVPEEDKDIIKGIIEDELNHSIILQRLQEKYTGVVPSEFEPMNTLKKKEDGC